MAASTQQTSLDTKIREIVELVKSIEHFFPSIIILHDVRDWTVVYMSQNGLLYLNTTMKELELLGTEYHKKFFNPDESRDYVPGIVALINKENSDESISHFQQVRPSPSEDWRWHLSSVKIILRDHEGKAVLSLTTSIPIDPSHSFTAKVERLVQENNFLRKNSKVFQSLSKREREILALIARGRSPAEIAADLFISEATASTHRRNIRQKINAQSNYDLTQFAQAFNLI